MRPVDSATAEAVSRDATRPVFLVMLGFNTPAYLSSGAIVTSGSSVFAPASITVKGSPPAIEIFNDGLGVGASVLNEGTVGRALVIYEVYGTDTVTPGAPAGYTPLVELFSGEMSSAIVGETVKIKTKTTAPLRCPRKIIAPPACNYLPAKGTRIEMPAEVYILK